MLNGQPHPQHELSDFEAIMPRLAPLFSRLGPRRFGLQQVLYDLVWRGMLKLGQNFIVTNPDHSRYEWLPLADGQLIPPPNFLLFGTVVYSFDEPTIVPAFDR